MSAPQRPTGVTSIRPDLTAAAANLKPEAFEKKSSIDTTHEYVRKENDERFAEYAIVQNKSTQDVLLMKEKVHGSEKDARLEIASADQRKNLNHPHIQKLVDYCVKTKSDFCSKFYKVRLFFEYPDSDLKKQIAARKKSLSYFESEELTHLAYQALSGLKYLHSRNIAFGDLRPEYISWNKQDIKHKLLERLRDPSDAVTANRNNLMNQRPLYCSPAIFEIIKKKTQKPHDEAKDDAWSLGMCLLEAGTLDNLQDIYKSDGTIDQARLGQHLQGMDARYMAENQILCELVHNLLSIPEEQRLTPTAISEQLPAYDVVCQHFDSLRNQQPAQQGGNQWGQPQQQQGWGQPQQQQGWGQPQQQQGWGQPQQQQGWDQPQQGYEQPLYAQQAQPGFEQQQAVQAQPSFVRRGEQAQAQPAPQPVQQPVPQQPAPQQPVPQQPVQQQPVQQQPVQQQPVQQQPVQRQAPTEWTSQQSVEFVPRQPVAVAAQPSSLAVSQPVYQVAPQPTSVYTQPSTIYTQPVYQVAPQPAPVYAQPAPVYAQPVPIYAQAAPVYAQPVPIYAQAPPSYTTGARYVGQVQNLAGAPNVIPEVRRSFTYTNQPNRVSGAYTTVPSSGVRTITGTTAVGAPVTTYGAPVTTYGAPVTTSRVSGTTLPTTTAGATRYVQGNTYTGATTVGRPVNATAPGTYTNYTSQPASVNRVTGAPATATVYAGQASNDQGFSAQQQVSATPSQTQATAQAELRTPAGNTTTQAK